MNQTTQRAIAGAVAGTLATAPMSAVMLAWHRRLPWSQRDPLPPVQITEELTKAAGVNDDLTHEQQLALAAVSHFAYGAATGSLYGLVGQPKSPSAAAATGIALGLGVWGASYLGLMPATGLYRSATDEPAGRNAMMIAAHVVWGAAWDWSLML